MIKGDVLTLIDAGVNTEAAWNVFQTQLAEMGYRPDDIEQVVLTHHHPDHIGLLARLREDIPVFGHSYCVPWLINDPNFMRHHDAFYMELFHELGLTNQRKSSDVLKQMKSTLALGSVKPLTNTIAEGETLPNLDEWKIIETLGHAQSHLSFYRESDGVLIAGDHILAHISSNPLLEPPLQLDKERPKPQLQYRDSLMKLLPIDIHIAYTGHGENVRDIQTLVQQRLRTQHEKALLVKEMVQREALPALKICEQLFPTLFRKQMGFTLSATIGLLDYLQSLEMIDKKLDDFGVAYYATKSK
nr:MBL fold metallo-hydrolase [Heyndrickxia ginsengihumi]